VIAEKPAHANHVVWCVTTMWHPLRIKFTGYIPFYSSPYDRDIYRHMCQVILNCKYELVNTHWLSSNGSRVGPGFCITTPCDLKVHTPQLIPPSVKLGKDGACHSSASPPPPFPSINVRKGTAHSSDRKQGVRHFSNLMRFQNRSDFSVVLWFIWNQLILGLFL